MTWELLKKIFVLSQIIALFVIEMLIVWMFSSLLSM